MARSIFGQPPSREYLNASTNATHQAIVDTGATSIFIMDGINVVNKCLAMKALTINMPDGRKVTSTHGNITIPGLPLTLMGHIVPYLAAASLMGKCLLCNAGCMVVFDKDKCDVIYDGNVILRGYKDRSTNLWTLPIICWDMRSALPQSAPVVYPALYDRLEIHPGITMANVTHSVKTRANGVKFAHQLLCNPKISTLPKAVCKGFLNGCPNLSEKLILKYLNPSPAMAKTI
jgi:hypothetical protein